jgi:hypothetical protein
MIVTDDASSLIADVTMAAAGQQQASTIGN